MLEHSLATFECQVQSGELGIALLEFVDHAQGLQVMLEAAVSSHAFIERILSGVTERRVPEIMGEANGLRERLVDVEGPRDSPAYLCDLERMCDSRAVQITLVIH